jgi:hypothetical protein
MERLRGAIRRGEVAAIAMRAVSFGSRQIRMQTHLGGFLLNIAPGRLRRAKRC